MGCEAGGGGKWSDGGQGGLLRFWLLSPSPSWGNIWLMLLFSAEGQGVVAVSPCVCWRYCWVKLVAPRPQMPRWCCGAGAGLLGYQGMEEQPWRYPGVAGAWRDTIIRPGGHSMVVGTLRALAVESVQTQGVGHGREQPWERVGARACSGLCSLSSA